MFFCVQMVTLEGPGPHFGGPGAPGGIPGVPWGAHWDQGPTFNEFWWILAPLWEPSGHHLGTFSQVWRPKWGPGRHQEKSDASDDLRECPMWLPHSKHHMFWRVDWIRLWSFWESFGVNLGSLLESFGDLWASFYGFLEVQESMIILRWIMEAKSVPKGRREDAVKVRQNPVGPIRGSWSRPKSRIKTKIKRRVK